MPGLIPGFFHRQKGNKREKKIEDNFRICFAELCNLSVWDVAGWRVFNYVPVKICSRDALGKVPTF